MTLIEMFLTILLNIHPESRKSLAGVFPAR